MSHRRRDGFTLVELLVVITIIGMLMALLLPAVNAAVEAARNTQCKNNMRQLAIGADSYENRRNHYPGYANTIGPSGSTYVASWGVEMLPQFDRIDLHDIWSSGPPPWSSGADGQVYLELMICPSDPPDQVGGTPLSYVANSGFATDTPGTLANGIFHGSNGPRSSVDTILDGKSFTLCFSENIQADTWDLNTGDSDTEPTMRNSSTFVWHNTDGTSNDQRINSNKTGAATNNINTARPSSYHTGGVNIAFCDTRVIFVKDEIPYETYRQLMTAHHKESDATDSTTHILNEKDLK